MCRQSLDLAIIVLTVAQLVEEHFQIRRIKASSVSDIHNQNQIYLHIWTSKKLLLLMLLGGWKHKKSIQKPQHKMTLVWTWYSKITTQDHSHQSWQRITISHSLIFAGTKIQQTCSEIPVYLKLVWKRLNHAQICHIKWSESSKTILILQLYRRLTLCVPRVIWETDLPLVFCKPWFTSTTKTLVRHPLCMVGLTLLMKNFQTQEISNQ